jgi:hypothetical protein
MFFGDIWTHLKKRNTFFYVLFILKFDEPPGNAFSCNTEINKQSIYLFCVSFYGP